MTQNLTGLATEDDAGRSSNVIPFRKLDGDFHSSTNATAVGNLEYVPSDDTKRQRPITRAKHDVYGQTFVAVQPASREILQNAFERITDALDSSLEQAERSNSFDRWKDLLKNIALKTTYFSSNHRKVLGTLITSTVKKDISDFNDESMKVFVQNTNILRQPRITKPEARQAINSLLNVNIDPLIPLNVDNSDERSLGELDNMMADILEEDKKANDKI